MSGWEIKEFPSLWEKSDPTISEAREQDSSCLERSSMMKSADKARPKETAEKFVDDYFEDDSGEDLA